MTSISRHALKFGVFVLLAIACTTAFADLCPPYYCGTWFALVTTPSGAPVQDGVYSIRMDIYNDSTGGIVRYSQTFSNLLVNRGLFKVTIGGNQEYGDIFDGRLLFLEPTILSGPGGGFPLTFSPRSQMTTMPSPWVHTDSTGINYSSNVAIGSADPVQRLTISKAGNFSISLINEAEPANSRRWHISSVGGSMRFRSMADDETTVQAEALSLIRNGNVGVGAIVPTEKLEVAGNIKASQLKLGNVTIRSGVGSPEGIVIGSVGDLFLRADGGNGTVFYVKESGAGPAGWVAK